MRKYLTFFNLIVLICAIIYFYLIVLDIWIIIFLLVMFVLIFIYSLLGRTFGLSLDSKADVTSYIKDQMIISFFNKIFVDNKILYDIIFFAYFILFPWNWMTYIVIYLNSKIFGVKVWINGNKDVFFKKYFNIDTRNVNLSLLRQYKIYLLYNWIIKYPILRLLLIPNKIRVNIWQNDFFWPFKFFSMCLYAFLFLYYNVFDYDFPTLLFFFYLYLSVIWPIIIIINVKYRGFKEDIEYLYLYPSINVYALNSSNSITWKLFSLYVETVNEMNNDYLFHKYGFYGDKGINIDHYYKMNIWLEYEKNYGISFLLYRILVLRISVYNISGIILDNSKFEEYSFCKENYKYLLFLMMDMRRFIGFKDCDLLHDENTVFKSYLDEELWTNFKNFIINEKTVIPKEFVLSNKLYNNLFNNIKYINYFSDYLDIDSLINNEKKLDIDYESNFIKIRIIYKEALESYIKEYEKLEDKNVLISNEQLKKLKRMTKYGIRGY